MTVTTHSIILLLAWNCERAWTGSNGILFVLYTGIAGMENDTTVELSF